MKTGLATMGRGALVAAFWLGSATAANALEHFLQIEGLQGGSTNEEHKKWTEIDGFSWGVKTETVLIGGGTRVGKPIFLDFTWTQPVDPLVPKLFEAVATGKSFASATLDVTRDAPDSSFFQMIFKSALPDALSIKSGDSGPEATAALAYDKSVKLRYRAQDGNGGFLPWVEGTFALGSKTSFSGDPDVILGLFLAGGTVTLDAPLPVPEPASAALLAAGLGGVLLAVRRRRPATAA